MGADYISLGLTIEGSKLPDPKEIRGIIAKHIDALVDNLGAIDESGLLDFDVQELADARNIEDLSDRSLVAEALTERLLSGLLWLVDPYNREVSTFDIPGTPYLFVTSGGMSWGDSPFDAYDSVVLVANAVDAVTALGPDLGIVGGGIRLNYWAEEGK